MNQDIVPPLTGRPQRRSWIAIMFLRPLSKNPQSALVLTRRGRLVGVIPAGANRVLSDYFDLPCEVIEVDGRERRLALNLMLESLDSGRFFQIGLQVIYQVMRPERVALEVDDALGELEQAITSASRNSVRYIGLDQPATVKESIADLMRADGTVAQRATALGIALRRADIVVEAAPNDRAYAEQLRDLQRERQFTMRVIVESLDPRTSFDISMVGSYRFRSRTALRLTIDEGEFLLRDALSRTARRVGIEFAPQEYREATMALNEALRTSPILATELATSDIELLRPAADIHPARPMLAAAMQARLLPAPTNASDDPFERILPPLAPATPAVLAPTVTPAVSNPLITPMVDPTPAPVTPASIPSPTTSTSMPGADSNDEELDLWDDPPSTPTNAITPAWQVDTALFGSAETSQPPAPALPFWLNNLADLQSSLHDTQPTDEDPSAEATDDETDFKQADDEYAEIEQEDEAENLHQIAVDEETLAAPTSPQIRPAALPSSTAATQKELISPQPAIVTPPPANSQLVLRIIADRAAIEEQIARWMTLLGSDGEEELHRMAYVIMEDPSSLPNILSGLIRDPDILKNSKNPDYQRALADQLGRVIPAAPVPTWLANTSTTASADDESRDEQTLPEWLRTA